MNGILNDSCNTSGSTERRFYGWWGPAPPGVGEKFHSSGQKELEHIPTNFTSKQMQ